MFFSRHQQRRVDQRLPVALQLLPELPDALLALFRSTTLLAFLPGGTRVGRMASGPPCRNMLGVQTLATALVLVKQLRDAF